VLYPRFSRVGILRSKTIFFSFNHFQIFLDRDGTVMVTFSLKLSHHFTPARPALVGSLSGLRQSQTLLLHVCVPPGQSSISRRPSPFSSTAYKMLFPQPLCFDNDPFSWGVYPPQRGNHELHNHELQLHRCNASSYHQERLLFTPSIARGPLPASFRQWQTLPQLRLPVPFWSLSSPFHRQCRRGCLSPTTPK
jgi:hypothetical protein